MAGFVNIAESLRCLKLVLFGTFRTAESINIFYNTKKTRVMKSEILTYVPFHYKERLVSGFRSVNDTFDFMGYFAA